MTRTLGLPQSTTVTRRPRVRLVMLSILAVLLTLVFLAPLVYTVLMSLRTSTEISQNALGLPSALHIENYGNVARQMNYTRALGNSLLITSISTLLTLLLGALAAYPLARLPVRWTGWLYQSFIVGLTIPVFVLITPLYLLMRDLQLVDTYIGVILIYTAFNLPAAVFFYVGFLSSVPRELEEAAVVDGASPWQTFRYVVLPLLQPVTGTVGMFIALSVWNDLIIPLLFLPGEGRGTLMSSTYSFVGRFGAFDPTQLFPAAVLATLPLIVVFLILQRQIIAGITAGAVKG